MKRGGETKKSQSEKEQFSFYLVLVSRFYEGKTEEDEKNEQQN